MEKETEEETSCRPFVIVVLYGRLSIVAWGSRDKIRLTAGDKIVCSRN